MKIPRRRRKIFRIWESILWFCKGIWRFYSVKTQKFPACGGLTLTPVKFLKNPLTPVIWPDTPPPPGGLAIGKGSTLDLKFSPFVSTSRHDVSPMALSRPTSAPLLHTHYGNVPPSHISTLSLTTGTRPEPGRSAQQRILVARWGKKSLIRSSLVLVMC